ncbi:MAG: LysM peptidoglycan-binding domain-containing protein [bacterium]
MRLLYSFVFCFLFTSVCAQKVGPFSIKRSGDGSFFVEHKVLPKENWYSVGRIYMISPREIAAFNGLSIEKGLGIGQTLEVPLTKSNFSQLANASEGGIPIVHVVQPKEGLFRLASLYNVEVTLLKKWNALKGDQVNSGFKLIVGYIKAAALQVDVNNVSVVKQNETIAVSRAAPVPSPEEVKSKKEPEKPVSSYVAPEPKASVSLSSKQTVQSVAPSSDQELKDNGVGHFFQTFNMQSKEGSLKKLAQPVYGIFKSTSGWQDGKYYVLMNDVVPGTIVRIAAAQTGKEIYAKVLAPVPAGKESEGMLMRMSNASAAALGLGEATNANLSIQWHN